MSGLLCLDRGNEALKGALFDTDRIVRRWREAPDTQAARAQAIIQSADPEGVAYCSVVPPWTAALRALLTSRGTGTVLEVGAQITLPFELHVDHPELLGPDRIAAACGAVALGLRTAVIVDCGTAATVDILIKDRFCGGSIFPGPALILRSLHEGTSALPVLDQDETDPVLPGRNTKEAIRAGAYWGFIGAIRELIRRSFDALPGRPAVILTGGGAPLVAGHLDIPFAEEPDLVFYGLKLLYGLNMEGA